MKLTFLGVRGSIPSPGPHTLKYGGNTTCLLLEFPGRGELIIDAGSGLRTLSTRLAESRGEIRMLLTHSHWDHISGFPFFVPIYQSGRRIHLFCAITEEHPVPGVLSQMQAPLFPVSHESLAADIRIEPITAGTVFSPLEGVEVTPIALNHPDPGLAFRIEADGKSLVFVTDNELRPPDPPVTAWSDWVEFCRDCDVLVHDATFTDAELPARAGWGHSSWEDSVRLGCDAGARTVMLFHHDIDRSDAELEAILREAREMAGDGCVVELARENAVVKI